MVFLERVYLVRDIIIYIRPGTTVRSFPRWRTEFLMITDFDLIAYVSGEIDRQLEAQMEKAEEFANLIANGLSWMATDRPVPVDADTSPADRDLIEAIWNSAKVVAGKRAEIDQSQRQVSESEDALASLGPPPNMFMRIALSLLSIVFATVMLLATGCAAAVAWLYLRSESITDTPFIGFVLVAVAFCGMISLLLYTVMKQRKENTAKVRAHLVAVRQLRRTEAELAARTAERDAAMVPLQAEVLVLVKRDITAKMQRRREEILGVPEN